MWRWVCEEGVEGVRREGPGSEKGESSSLCVYIIPLSHVLETLVCSLFTEFIILTMECRKFGSKRTIVKIFVFCNLETFKEIDNNKYIH